MHFNFLTLANLSASVSIVTFLVMFILLFFILKSKSGVQRVEHALSTTETAVKTAEPLMALTPLAPAVHIVDEILKAAEVGVNEAEQLYITGKAIDRKAKAVAYVTTTLEELGFKITDRIGHLIDGAVEGAVYLLPETDHSKQATADQAPNPPKEEAPAETAAPAPVADTAKN